MAKKFGTLALLGVVAGAAAGTYYYLQNKNKKSEEAPEDLDDFDDFDDDLEDEDFSSETKSHPYISIDLENAKEKIGGKVIETLDKTKEKLEQLNVSEKIDKAKEYIGEKISGNDAAPVYTDLDITSGAASEASVENEDAAVKEEAAAKEDDDTAKVSSTYSAESDAKESDLKEDFFSHE